MLKVAITGNIASGKSFVEAVVSSFGYDVYDTDMIAHKILALSGEVREAFKDYDILNHKGEISRGKLGKLVFCKKELKTILESIIHPQIVDEINKLFKYTKEEEIIFISVPLLFEAKLDKMFDKVIFVQADDEVRLQRLMVRNSLTEEEAKLRMDSQLSQEEKIKRCDFVVHNNSTMGEFEEQIKDVIKKLVD